MAAYCTHSSTILLLALAAALSVTPSRALSWPLCDNGGQVWVTERPYTEPTFPGANLWFFCDSGLNVLGSSVDPCINSGTTCGEAVYDGLCQTLGFDRAWMDGVVTVNASLSEPVQSLTGEFCLRAGLYSETVPDDLESLPGEHCEKIDGITCIRNRETMTSALGALKAEPAGPESRPPVVEPAASEGAGGTSAEGPEPVVLAADRGGRKLRGLHNRM